MTLQAKFTNKQLEYITDRFEKGSYPNKGYKSIYHLKNYGFNMFYKPHNPLWKFNAKIVLQTAFFKSEYKPHSILEILTMLPWNITTLDLAYDFFTLKENSFSYKHHGRVSHQQISDEHGHTTLYLGAFNPNRKNNRTADYDRNEKEYSRNMSDYNRHLYANRCEAKTVFKIGEQPLNDIDHQLIINQLEKKYIFVSNIDNMETDGFTKRKFRKIREDYNRLDNYYKKEKSKLKAVAVANKEPLEHYYNQNKDRLFNFIIFNRELTSRPSQT
ncbi:hypothetical protein [Sporosarcina sp. A2]|uniref:hypothetical protein n=1 Tax=Sporosarcina sp. A2 TaxID=3393449 RepID=UPI003D7B7C01